MYNTENKTRSRYSSSTTAKECDMMTIERLEEIKNTLYEALNYQENVRDFSAEEQMEKDVNKLIDAEIERQKKLLEVGR